MKTRHLALMATVAVAALAIGLTTTSALTVNPGSDWVAPSTTTSTSIMAETGKFDPTLKTTALQAKQNTANVQFGPTIASIDTMFKTMGLGIANGKRMFGDNEAAKTSGLWAAITRDTVGFYGKQVQARDFDLKGVAVINRAKHPAVEYVYMRFHSLGAGIG